MDGDPELVLKVLSAVERDERLTQRHLSRDLGIALGLTNTYLKRCLKKGYIKVSQAPLNRYAYYLTPRGFAEKARLTSQYLEISFDFFRTARRQLTDLVMTCRRAGIRHAILLGDGELAEVTILSALEANIEIVAIVDERLGRRICGGRPVVPSIETAIDALPADAIVALVLTDMHRPQETFDNIRRWAESCERRCSLIAPELLGLRGRDHRLIAIEAGDDAAASPTPRQAGYSAMRKP